MTEKPEMYLINERDSIGVKNILLVDDDLDDQELIIEAIKNINANIAIKTLTNGNKAILYLLDLAEDELPHLIVLDYNLPELNGCEILEALSKHQRFDSIPKVIWSTSGSGLYEPRCLAMGALAYLVKPSDLSGINKLAKQMVDFCNAS